MTPEQLQQIARDARQAAVAAKSNWPVSNPYVAGSDEHRVWQERFLAALKGGQ